MYPKFPPTETTAFSSNISKYLAAPKVVLTYLLSPPKPAKNNLLEADQPSLGSNLLSVLSIELPKDTTDKILSPAISLIDEAHHHQQ